MQNNADLERTARSDGTLQNFVGNDVKQETHKSQPDVLPLRSGVIGAGEAADIQRPTAASLPVSNFQQRHYQKQGGKV